MTESTSPSSAGPSDRSSPIDFALALLAAILLVIAAATFGATSDVDFVRAHAALRAESDGVLQSIANAAIRASLSALGPTTFGLRAPSLAFSLATTALVAWAARRAFGAHSAPVASLVFASLPLTAWSALHDARASLAALVLALAFAASALVSRYPWGPWAQRALVVGSVALAARNTSAVGLSVTLEGLAHRSFPWIIAIVGALSASAEDRDDSRSTTRSSLVLAIVTIVLAATRDATPSTIALAAVPLALLVSSYEHNERPPTLNVIVALALAAIIARDLSLSPQALRALDTLHGSADARRDPVETWLAVAPWCGFALAVVGAIASRRQQIPRACALVASIVVVATNEADYARTSSPRAALRAAHAMPDTSLAVRDRASAIVPLLDAPMSPRSIQSDDEAGSWLIHAGEGGALLVHRDQWASINALVRSRLHRNLGFEGGHAVGWALASTRPEAERRNPLFEIVSSTAPTLRANERRRELAPRPRFDDGIELAFVDVLRERSTVSESARFRVSLSFHAASRVREDRRVFVHGDSACPRINVDHEPAQGRYPTALWAQGDWVRDEFTVSIPWHCDARSVRVFVGLYRGDSRARVSIGAHDGADRVLATTLELD